MLLWRVVVLGVCVRMSLRSLECRSARLCMLDGVSFFVPRNWGQVQSPTIGGSATLTNMSSFFVLLRRCVRLRLLRHCV